MAQGSGAPRVAPAAAITRSASLQSYLTIRWLADRAHRADAFALYAYFRWLDDMVDVHLADRDERLVFVARQRSLLAQAADGTTPADASPEEASSRFSSSPTAREGTTTGPPTAWLPR